MSDAREKLIEILDAERKWPDAPETADAILSAMPDIVRGMVKPLEWVGGLAETPFGAYYVTEEGDDAWSFSCVEYPYAEKSEAEFESEQSAMAAANAHNAAQVLTSLGLGIENDTDDR